MLAEDFNVDPTNLNVAANDHAYIKSLYATYGDELSLFCSQMVSQRQKMIAEGYSCDFSDRESELLYLLIRDLKPSVVVEISPCHGYSTNYILGALTQNEIGKLHSYEIVEHVNDKPIEQVITDNQLESLDLGMLNVYVGDATRIQIPDADFLFIDSAHEAWFTGWYFQELVTRSKTCFVHDIVIDVPGYKTIIPKGPFMGIRESLTVLELLAINDQRLLSVAALGKDLDRAEKFNLPRRYPNAPERSAVFLGHKQTRAAAQLCQGMIDVKNMQVSVLHGDREVVKKLSALVNRETPGLLALAAAQILLLAGYRSGAIKAEFPDLHKALLEISGNELKTVSQVVAALELGAQICEPKIVANAFRASRNIGVTRGAQRIYKAHYLAHSLGFNYWYSSIWTLLDRLKKRLFA